MPAQDVAGNQTARAARYVPYVPKHAGAISAAGKLFALTPVLGGGEFAAVYPEPEFVNAFGVDPLTDSNATPEEPTPFTVPMSRKYIGNRIVAAQTLHRYHSLATSELLSFVDFILTSPNAGSTAIVFNVKVDGEPIWAGGARPSIAPGASRATKTDVAVSLVRAVSLIEIVVESVPSIGVPAPITSMLDAVVS